MKKPLMNKSQFALLMADGATGHIISTDYQIYTSDKKDVYFFLTKLNLSMSL